MKPPYAPMWPATLYTYATIPCRIIYIIWLLFVALLFNKCEDAE